MGKDKIYDMLKRIFRIQAGFALFRSWSHQYHGPLLRGALS